MKFSNLFLCLFLSTILNFSILLYKQSQEDHKITKLNSPINIKILQGQEQRTKATIINSKNRPHSQKKRSGQLISPGQIKELLGNYSQRLKIENNDGYVAIVNSKNKALDKDENYSFYIRVIEKYLTQINLNFYDLIKNQQLKSSERMLGQIIFDKEGNAQQLKIHHWAEDNQTQDQFLLSLKNIRRIQNPPKNLVVNNETFTIFYGLNINL